MIKYAHNVLFTAAWIWFGLFAHAAATAASTQIAPDEIEKLLPPYIGAAVVAIDDGKIIFKHCWGKKRSDSLSPVNSVTNFRLASASKQFTATAILTLVDRGKINLTDTLDRFFFECPDYWQEITVHHLLTHTSGLPDYESLIPEGTTLQVSDYDVLALLCDTSEPKFACGSKFAYSNSGYMLLGLIVEAVAGRPYHEYLRAEVFETVGMGQSVCYVKGMNQIADRAFGHALTAKNIWEAADQSVASAVRGDGAIYSSLEDLTHWITALEDGRLLSEELARTAIAPHVKSTLGEEHYGYGWFVGEHRNCRRIWHGGSTRGFSVMIQRFPERKAAVIILLNRSPLQPAGDYTDRIVDRLLFADAKADVRLDKLDTYFASLVEKQEFNGAAVVAENGKVLFRFAHGYADFESKTPNAIDTSFPIASITKSLTATAVLQLVDRGKLGLDDAVAKYLRGFPYPSVTVRHLLSHSSGLPTYNAFFDAEHESDAGRVFTNADFLPGMQRNPQKLLSEPGQQVQYSNTNYLVLALVIESVAGMSYPDYIKTNILQVADMNDTYFAPISQQLSQQAGEKFAFPYIYPRRYSDTPSRSFSIPYVADYWRAYNFTGFGDYVSTLDDLLKFDHALNSGKLVELETLAHAYEPAILNDGRPNGSRFGLGWMSLIDSRAGTLVYHSGMTTGLSSVLVRNPNKHQVVVVFDNAHYHAEEVGMTALRILNGAPAPAIKKSAATTYGRALASGGQDAAVRVYAEIQRDADQYKIDLDEFNQLGYDFMGRPGPFHLPVEHRYEDAARVFQINTKQFPDSWRAWDSYGEALMALGRDANAIEVYSKSLELNPDNQNGKKKLSEIVDQKD